MNASTMTRKEQVYERLRESRGQWVDGPELANERVGGSEGLRRVRELRQEGHVIEERKHPDASRDIYQYRLTGRQWRCIKCGANSTGPLAASLSPGVMFGRCPKHGSQPFTEAA